MSELNVTNSPGVYYYWFDTDGMDANDYYFEADSVTAATSPWAGWMSTGNTIGTTDLLAMVYEDTETFQDFLRIARAVLAGDRSGFKAGAAGRGQFASVDDSKARIISPHDANGNTIGDIIIDTTD
jgi:hypothetical protein